jgi:hypothetical protein
MISCEVPTELASHAAFLGSAARDLQEICIKWEWVLTSSMLTSLQMSRVQVAISYRTRVVQGGGDEYRVLLVPFMDIFHDCRLRKRDVLFTFSD